MKTLTFEQAFSIQLEGIAKWSKVLNSATYCKLIEEVTKRNEAGYNDPYNVCRGADLSNIVENIMYQEVN